jgi:hypothetical protein
MRRGEMQIQQLRIARGPRRSNDMATAAASMRNRGRGTAGAGASSRDDATLDQRARRENYEVDARGSRAGGRTRDVLRTESPSRDYLRLRAAKSQARQAPGSNKRRYTRCAWCRSNQRHDSGPTSGRDDRGPGARSDADVRAERQWLRHEAWRANQELPRCGRAPPSAAQPRQNSAKAAPGSTELTPTGAHASTSHDYNSRMSCRFAREGLSRAATMKRSNHNYDQRRQNTHCNRADTPY